MYQDLDDDEHTVCEHEPDEVTMFEPTPLGARQRLLPGPTFAVGTGPLVKVAAEAVEPPRPVIAILPSPLPPLPPPIRKRAAQPPPTFAINAPVMFLSMATPPAAAAPVAIATPSLRPYAIPRSYALPLFGVAAVILLSIAYVAKPSSHHATSPVATSLTTSQPAREIVAIVAPAPAIHPKLIVTEIAPVAEIAPTIAPVAEIAPTIAPVAKPHAIRRPSMHSSTHQAKAASTAHVSRQRMAKLDATADLSSPLGRLRPR